MTKEKALALIDIIENEALGFICEDDYHQASEIHIYAHYSVAIEIYEKLEKEAISIEDGDEWIYDKILTFDDLMVYWSWEYAED